MDSFADARFAHTPPQARREKESLLVCGVTSEGVNTHPALHKLSPLYSPPPREGHIHTGHLCERQLRR